jgi:hypothetical protein
MNRRTAASTLSAALLLVLCASPAVRGADPVEAVAPDPTGAQLAEIDQKLDAARDWMAVKTGTLTLAQFNAEHPEAASAVRAAAAVGETTITPSFTGGQLGLVQVSQTTSYRCGSATAYEILKYKKVTTGPGGETLSQPNVGKKCAVGYLCTEVMTPNKETPWYVGPSYPDANGFPMPSTLNKWTKTSWYVTSKASAFSLTDYEFSLPYDIDHAYPLALDIHEHANSGNHLADHPGWVDSKHWIAAFGYANTGASTIYADSVHGLPTSVISWASYVKQPYYTHSSSQMYTLMSEFGWIW